jgi:hypothetical protein
MARMPCRQKDDRRRVVHAVAVFIDLMEGNHGEYFHAGSPYSDPPVFRSRTVKKPKANADPVKLEITPEIRFHLINDAAYFREMQNIIAGKKPCDSARAWCEVEAEIDAVIRKHSH